MTAPRLSWVPGSTAVGVVIALGGAACADGTRASTDPTPSPAADEPCMECPGWVLAGTRSSSETGVVFAVGAARNISNQRLRKLTAENRARAEMEKMLTVITAATVDRGCRLTSLQPTPDSIAREDAEQRVRVFFQEAMERALASTEFVQSWFNPESDTLHVLAKADLNPLLHELEIAPDVPEPVKATFRTALLELDPDHPGHTPPE